MVEPSPRESPRMLGMAFGPADLAASRAMKTTRVGGGHPSYGVLADAGADVSAPRALFKHDIGHLTVAAAGEAQFRNAFLQGCVGAWTLHPSQIEIARRVFTPDPAEAAFARRILEAMPDGTGAVMVDGKMQDDATWTH